MLSFGELALPLPVRLTQQHSSHDNSPGAFLPRGFGRGPGRELSTSPRGAAGTEETTTMGSLTGTVLRRPGFLQACVLWWKHLRISLVSAGAAAS